MSRFQPAGFKRRIRELEPLEFEQFVADLWEAQGWNTRVTKGSQDRGVDVVATRSDPISQKHLLQVKRYGADNVVGSPEVQQYASLQRQERGVDAVIIVTSSKFSRQAERIARDLNVKLVDGSDLYNLIESHDLDAIVAEYFPSPESESSTPDASDVSPSEAASSNLQSDRTAAPDGQPDAIPTSDPSRSDDTAPAPRQNIPGRILQVITLVIIVAAFVLITGALWSISPGLGTAAIGISIVLTGTWLIFGWPF